MYEMTSENITPGSTTSSGGGGAHGGGDGADSSPLSQKSNSVSPAIKQHNHNRQGSTVEVIEHESFEKHFERSMTLENSVMVSAATASGKIQHARGSSWQGRKIPSSFFQKQQRSNNHSRSQSIDSDFLLDTKSRSPGKPPTPLSATNSRTRKKSEKSMGSNKRQKNHVRMTSCPVSMKIELPGINNNDLNTSELSSLAGSCNDLGLGVDESQAGPVKKRINRHHRSNSYGHSFVNKPNKNKDRLNHTTPAGRTSGPQIPVDRLLNPGNISGPPSNSATSSNIGSPHNATPYYNTTSVDNLDSNFQSVSIQNQQQVVGSGGSGSGLHHRSISMPVESTGTGINITINDQQYDGPNTNNQQHTPQQQTILRDDPSLPSGWQVGFDSRTNRSFYVDHNNKTTTWSHPMAPAAQQHHATDQQAPNAKQFHIHQQSFDSGSGDQTFNSYQPSSQSERNISLDSQATRLSNSIGSINERFPNNFDQNNINISAQMTNTTQQQQQQQQSGNVDGGFMVQNSGPALSTTPLHPFIKSEPQLNLPPLDLSHPRQPPPQPPAQPTPPQRPSQLFTKQVQSINQQPHSHNHIHQFHSQPNSSSTTVDRFPQNYDDRTITPTQQNQMFYPDFRVTNGQQNNSSQQPQQQQPQQQHHHHNSQHHHQRRPPPQSLHANFGQITSSFNTNNTNPHAISSQQPLTSPAIPDDLYDMLFPTNTNL